MISELINGICIGIAIGLAFGILTVYTWYSNNYNATRYQFMRCALRERISSLEMELSMRKFENEHLYKKILERDDKK